MMVVDDALKATADRLQASSNKAHTEQSFAVLQRVTELSQLDTEHCKYSRAWLEARVTRLAIYSERWVSVLH